MINKIILTAGLMCNGYPSESISSYSKTLLGIPYTWGGQSEKGMDCSGFIQIILTRYGFDFPRDLSSAGLYTYFSNPKRGTELLEPTEGALLFFGKDRRHITHVAYALSHTEMIEAGGCGRECKTAAQARARGAEVRIRPITGRNDLVSIIYPKFGCK